MTSHQEKHRLYGWYAVILTVVLITILAYPSVSRITRKEANQQAATLAQAYQRAVTACIEKYQGKLEHCQAGSAGIPAAYSSWFSAIKGVHVYRGVIMVDTRTDLGHKHYIYYVPRLISRHWYNFATTPRAHVTWQRLESPYCGLNNTHYRCEYFMMH